MNDPIIDELRRLRKESADGMGCLIVLVAIGILVLGPCNKLQKPTQSVPASCAAEVLPFGD